MRRVLTRHRLPPTARHWLVHREDEPNADPPVLTTPPVDEEYNAALVDFWAVSLKIGTPVVVTKDDGSKHATKVRSVPWLSSDARAALVLLEGISGGYALCRIQRPPEDPAEARKLAQRRPKVVKADLRAQAHLVLRQAALDPEKRVAAAAAEELARGVLALLGTSPECPACLAGLHERCSDCGDGGDVETCLCLGER